MFKLIIGATLLTKKVKYETLTLQCRIPYLTREGFKSHAAVLRI
jgi:hypothetical protein